MELHGAISEHLEIEPLTSINSDDFCFLGINFFHWFYENYIEKILQCDSKSFKRKAKSIPQAFLQAMIRSIVCVASIIKIVWIRIARKPRIMYSGITGRAIRSGAKAWDLYSTNILRALGREKCLVINADVDCDIHPYALYVMDMVLFTFASLIYRKKVRVFYRAIQEKYPQMTHLSITERDVLRFVSSYLKYRAMIKLFKIRYVYTVSRNKSLIAACKREHIIVIELQHGMITKSDYLHSGVFSSSNLQGVSTVPDYLAVWGEYWKMNALVGGLFKDSQIIQSGYYLAVPPQKKKPPGQARIILISVWPGISVQVFSQYIAFLKSRLLSRDWKILIKLHSSNHPDDFANLLEPGFVERAVGSVYELLSQANIHITGSSTVAFEAVRYPVANYALYSNPNTGLAYLFWKDIIDSGVAKPLMLDQLPIEEANYVESKQFFADFCPDQILPSRIGRMRKDSVT